MTELETLQRAKMYMDKLAQGIDPVSNQDIPGDSVLNNIRLARCFFYVSGVLGQVIDNGGVIGAEPRLEPFSVSSEQLSEVVLSDVPIRITQLVENIGAAVNNPRMKKLCPTVITNWLLEKGFLEKKVNAEGKSRRLPTSAGVRIGLSSQMHQGIHGEYCAVYYDLTAQRFVLDHLSQMLSEKAD